MRMSNSPKIGKSIAKMFAAALLASVATGCSSDATRFGGLFSSGPDQMTTASIPSRSGNVPAPVPQNDMGGGGYASSAPQGGYANQNSGMNQAYPASNGGYGSVQPSSARAASSSASVQRQELAAPSPATRREPANRSEAMAQPMPTGKSTAAPSMASARVNSNTADTLSTGSVKAADTGWHTDGASSVTLKSGETIATLSKRYGVPEKALLQANGLSSASAAAPGQSVVIPKFGQSRNAARAASGNIDLSKDNNGPAPTRGPEQNVAVLPSQNAARDKASAEAGKLTPPGGKPLPPTGGYKVQSGDSLAKIARANGVSVADLKAANGITDGNVRIGQTLKIPGAGTDGIKTASVQPQAPDASKPVEAPVAAAKVEAPKAPAAADASVSDVEKKSDMASLAPESTGIGKYRWPVRGAVISGFGENVDGSRNDGINISVPEGTPIKAAENGVVIYSGNGLKQLGNTVLIRHDDGRVTVYGNAANLEVQRGQKVQRGQTVATSGMTGSAKRPQVHFEVRKDATPVNPSSFLE
ncbi:MULTISPECIES: peptidoglycan DD-metalloendopeptidase family protein [Rhizobium]|uniref:peptidoglycan DD-metalloendopeptidase family protein n=1 Tax=Rhizobium TaxID=379 RepID=UPI001FADDCF0|nr:MULTISPECIES: peptidoglycan DD-metalloendopeptidase family protein [Rhizobium]